MIDSYVNCSSSIRLENKEYERLSQYILCRFGINIPSHKKTLLQSRLQKRLRIFNYSSFKDYVDYLFSPEGQANEVSYMIDAVSTNKTDFFREQIQFDFLFDQGIKELLIRTGKNKLNIWSAGCSSGEEPYSIAMVLKNYAEQRRFCDFSILATDISETVLQQAANGK